ncbi:MAG TPA: 2-C-methyl-D-erythritol 2,4-cyclodiphosphate synthase [bacterium]|jgi:2-C-methyl-D-erythritol 2,4-cyclodiphosphate synthase|nr:2-C-methyl-D-erythritol 2,4-cyclodiphosphate synthase [bacterium]HNT65319.1 2-C-methyl-D-erythritol 2,4-cyclodiphosphate synthase [bacterium]HOX86487.1 2-C-methyl-D-erythritol 2,4-cyclodiphosphate synthase [bacterium]HPG46513.1 2-C-methyl-D-erythritol 2,4-cyclodiphosphate synthase [bacterium]HPM98430.1 2-C-methyl-D-erythritol 2,4-cyclodiphosphate synthase [bacterium]
MRIGQGYDVHRLVPGRKLILGGVEIAGEFGLLGHSDADVLCHAISDALLGAAALGDIGVHFPDSEAAYRGASSIELLRRVVEKLAEAGWRPCNIDSTVVLQRPKIAPYIAQMRQNIADAVCLPVDSVSVKATTSERMDAVGRGEGAAAMAVVLIDQ